MSCVLFDLPIYSAWASRYTMFWSLELELAIYVLDCEVNNNELGAGSIFSLACKLVDALTCLGV